MRRVPRPLALPALLAVLWLGPLAGPATGLGGAVAVPVTFHPAPKTTLEVGGIGPVRGSIEVRRGGRGLVVVDTLSLEDYVAGVREVPGTWPMEALKAQAVAARTYALWELTSGAWQRQGFDVCATTECQVYLGLPSGRSGRRWLEAVRATAGQVLLYGGRPALTRYHSSSGGHTLPNQAVFPSDGPRPYLVGVNDPEDRVSPLHRWHVTFSRKALQAILHAGMGLEGELVDVRGSEASGSLMVVTAHGHLEMSLARFRDVVSAEAPRLYPDRYPSARDDGKPLPATLPSSRFDVVRTPDGFRIDGRGWGHGVGMSQWGAKGRAEEGQTYRQILAAYYHGLLPHMWRGRRLIRVGVLRDVSSVRVSADGVFGVEAGGAVLSRSTVGGWTVETTGARSLAVLPPPGATLPLVVTGLRVPRRVVLEGAAPQLHVELVVPKPALLDVRLKLGSRMLARVRRVVEAGEARLPLRLDPARLGGEASSRLDLDAFDGTTHVRLARTVELVRPPRRAPLAWAAAGALVAATVLVLRRRHPRGGGSYPVRRTGRVS